MVTAYLRSIVFGASLVAGSASASEAVDVSSTYDFIKLDYPGSRAGSQMAAATRRFSSFAVNRLTST